MGRLANRSDVIMHYIVDTQQIATSATTLLTFFKNPNATAGLSNLRADGRFPSPESFVAHSVQLAVSLETTMADAQEIYNGTGLLSLFVGKTWYIDNWPLNLIPLATGIGVSVGGTATALGGSASGVSARRISPGIPFNTDEVYSAEITWGTAPTPASAVNLQLIFGGVLTRQVQ